MIQSTIGRTTPGILLGMMRTLLLGVIATLWCVASAGAAEPTLRDAAGGPIAWDSWVAEHGPVVVLVWSSWAPGAKQVLMDAPSHRAAARARGLGFLLLDVQETFDEAKASLGGVDVTWFHDRHGVLLKRYRVIRVPFLLVVGADGTATEGREPPVGTSRRGDPS